MQVARRIVGRSNARSCLTFLFLFFSPCVSSKHVDSVEHSTIAAFSVRLNARWGLPPILLGRLNRDLVYHTHTHLARSSPYAKNKLYFTPFVSRFGRRRRQFLARTKSYPECIRFCRIRGSLLWSFYPMFRWKQILLTSIWRSVIVFTRYSSWSWSRASSTDRDFCLPIDF